MIVYTASDAREIAPQPYFEGLRYLCFSVAEPPKPWEWIKLDQPYADPCRNAKRPKILPWDFLPDWEVSLWIDCNMRLRADPRTIPLAPLAIHTHAKRDCVYDELTACVLLNKDDPDLLARQVSAYRMAGHPRKWGLWENGCLLRQNVPEVEALCRDWWEEIACSSCRDQLSLPVVLRRHNYTPKSLGNNIWESRWLEVLL